MLFKANSKLIKTLKLHHALKIGQYGQILKEGNSLPFTLVKLHHGDIYFFITIHEGFMDQVFAHVLKAWGYIDRLTVKSS